MNTDAPGRSPESLVNLAVDVFLAHPHADVDAIMDALEARGVARRDAWDLYLSVPLAFYRVAMRGRDLNFSDTYIAEGTNSGTRQTRRFSAQPLYVTAVRVAEGRVAGGLGGERLLSIIGHSAEFNAIHALVHRGSQVDSLRLTQPVLSAYQD